MDLFLWKLYFFILKIRFNFTRVIYKYILKNLHLFLFFNEIKEVCLQEENMILQSVSKKKKNEIEKIHKGLIYIVF